MQMIILAVFLGIHAIHDTSRGAPPKHFSFKHHFIDTRLPVYNSPNGWLIGDYGGAALADFDGDGDLDFAINRAPSGGGPQMFYWYEYQAPDRWVRHDAARDFTTALGAAVLDVDRDGRSDIIGGQSWYQNRGEPRTKQFQRIVYDPKGGGEHDIVLADVDGDGRKDVVTLYDQTGLHWYKLPGFQKRTIVPADPKGLVIHGGVAPGGAGDLDGDGDTDLFRANVWVENLDGKGTQWSQHPVPFSQTPRNNLVSVRSWIADLDRDGDNDIVTSDCDWMTNAKIRWLENADGRGRKWIEHAVGQGLDFHSLIVADFDRDGDLDLFTCDQEQGSGGYKWYLFENADGKAGSFTTHVLLDRALGGHEVQVGDVDGDGDLDLVSKLWGPAPDNGLSGKMHADYLENMAVSMARAADSAKATPRPTVGAIRWDGWFQDNPWQRNLDPKQWHDRVPFYGKVVSKNRVEVCGDSQDAMDREIAYAKAAALGDGEAGGPPAQRRLGSTPTQGAGRTAAHAQGAPRPRPRRARLGHEA